MLADNPFHLLRATQWDSRDRLLELSQDCELREEGSRCREALSCLLNPPQRLRAELGWFVGVSAEDQDSLLRALHGDLDGFLRLAQDAFLLAGVNAFSGFLRLRGDALPEKHVLTVVGQLITSHSSITPRDVLEQVNLARTSAGFLRERREEVIAEKLDEHRRELARLVLGVFEARHEDFLIRGLTTLAERFTAGGTSVAPPFLAELVRLYELAVGQTLESGRDSILTECRRLENHLEHEDTASLDDAIQKLAHDVSAWDRVAQPIQVVRRAEGRVHQPSMDIALGVRNLSVVVFNKTGNSQLPRLLNRLLRHAFAELDVITDQLKEDRDFLRKVTRPIAGGHPLGEIVQLLKAGVALARREPFRGREIAATLQAVVSRRLLPLSNGKALTVGLDLLAEAMFEIAEIMMSAHLGAAALDVCDRAFRIAQSPRLQERIVRLMKQAKANQASTHGGPGQHRTTKASTIKGTTTRTRARARRTRLWVERGKRIVASFLRGLGSFSLELAGLLVAQLVTALILIIVFMLPLMMCGRH